MHSYYWSYFGYELFTDDAKEVLCAWKFAIQCYVKWVVRSSDTKTTVSLLTWIEKYNFIILIWTGFQFKKS